MKYLQFSVFIVLTFYFVLHLLSMLRQKFIYRFICFVLVASFSCFAGASKCESVFFKFGKKALENRKKAHKIPDKAKVIHIPQIHRLPLAMTVFRSLVRDPHSVNESTARTQFSIAKLMMEHKDSIFVSEHFLDDKVTKPGTLSGIIRKYFFHVRPDFYKKNFEELTKKEKRALYFLGAAQVLSVLDHIESVYSYVPEDERNKKWSKIISEKSKENNQTDEILAMSNMFFDVRELWLKDKVEMLREEYPDKKIFFDFGLGHDFSYLFKRGSFYRVPDYVVLPEQFLFHPISTLSYSASLILRYNLFYDNVLSREESVPTKKLEGFKKDFERVHEVLEHYLENKDNYPPLMRFFDKKVMLLAMEVLDKIESIDEDWDYYSE